MSGPAIVLTDSTPLLDPDGRCPRCRADEARRVWSSGFGDPHEVCGSCGYEFLNEVPRG